MKPVKVGTFHDRPMSLFYAGKNYMIKVLDELPTAYDRKRGVGYRRYLIEVEKQQRILLYSFKFDQWFVEKIPEQKQPIRIKKHCCKDLRGLG